ncbi:T-cell immunomodulatory protein-like, partial [Sceloporus undulatus]|uniref:T-cell immunomodulatory protein-like n=1 Tax=Sceloporus undulatus TaxID=8520 RepID=UPI001C4D05BA
MGLVSGGGWAAFSLLALLLPLLRPSGALQNVTPQLFGPQAFGRLAAFGDFNSDKQTDLFVLRGDDFNLIRKVHEEEKTIKNSELNIFLADQKEPYFKPKVKLLLT